MGIKSPPLIRVLVLDESTLWRDALAEMYRSIFGKRGDVTTASSAGAAERQLIKQPVDLVSLNLSLSENRAASAEAERVDIAMLCDTGRFQLIEALARRRWATAIVLVVRTGEHDQARFTACDEAMLDEASLSPDEFVRRRFGNRAVVLNQPERWDLHTSIARFEELIRRRLSDLAGPGYTLRFGGTAYEQRVTIEAGRQTLTAFEGTDAMLLQTLAMAGRAGELLSDRSLLEIYRGRDFAAGVDAAVVTRVAQREIDGFRRRLRRQGVDDRALIVRVRKSTAGTSVPRHATGAWRLDGSVSLEGVSTVNVRGRGGPGFRPDAAAVDLADPKA